jgi:ABC-type transport system substrate-binding protein
MSGKNKVITRREFLRLAGAGAAASLLAACGPTPTPTPAPTTTPVVITKEVVVTPTPTPVKVIKLGIGIPDSWNPFLSGGARDVKGLLFNPLVGLDSKQNVVPVLADHWQVSPDGTVYTFFLRKDVKWHDGQPFTAKDVEFTLRSHVTKGTASAWAPLFVPIKGAKDFNAADHTLDSSNKVPGIEIVDDFTVRITLETASAGFWAALIEVPMLPQHILAGVKPEDIGKSAFSTGAPIGTGPFKFASWKADEFVELSRNDAYFKGAPKLDKVYLVKVDYDPAKAGFEAGQFDMVHLTAPDAVAWQTKAGVQIPKILATDYYAIGFCADPATCKPAIQPKQLRQAMLYAVDRQALNKVMQAGMGQVINTINMPPWVMDNCPLPNNYTYDPAKAKDLLKQINWDSNTELVLTHWGGWRELLATAMQQMWAAVGLKVRVDKFASAEAFQRVGKGTFGTMIMWPEQGSDPDFASAYFGDFYPAGNNQSRYRNPQLDALWVQGRQAVSPADRQKIYCQIAQIMNDDLPWGFLFTATDNVALTSRLQNVEIGHNADWGWHYWRNIEKWDVTK